MLSMSLSVPHERVFKSLVSSSYFLFLFSTYYPSSVYTAHLLRAWVYIHLSFSSTIRTFSIDIYLLNLAPFTASEEMTAKLT